MKKFEGMSAAADWTKLLPAMGESQMNASLSVTALLLTQLLDNVFGKATEDAQRLGP